MDVPHRSSDAIRLGRLATDIGFLLRMAQVKVYERYFREYGDRHIKPGEFSVLWTISHNPGIRQNVLCQELIIKRSHMTKLLRSMENRELVSRRVPDEDRRGVELTITDKGQSLVDEIAPWFFAFEDCLGAKMNASDREELKAQLLKFIASESAD